MKSERETLAVVIADGFHWKYLVNTGVLEKLINSGSKLEIFLPKSLENTFDNNAFFRKNMSTSIILQFVEVGRPTKLVSFLFRYSPYFNKRYTETESYQKEQWSRDVKGRIYLTFVKMLSFPFAVKIATWILSKSFKNEFIENKIIPGKYRGLILSTPGQKLFDIFFLLRAKEINLKTFCAVYSWDNLTGKGNIIFKPDRLSVWNKFMFNEAVELHKFNSNNVSVTGSPTFENYFKELKDGKKSDFIKSFGFKSSIRDFILVTTVPKRFYGSGHIDLVQILIELLFRIKNTSVGIIVRVHPMDSTSYSQFEGSDAVKIDYFESERATSRENALLSWMPRLNNIDHLRKSLKFAILNINVASTISIESALLGTPCLNIGFHIDNTKYLKYGDPMRFYKYTHLQNLVNANLTIICETQKSFISKVKKQINSKKSKIDFALRERALEFVGGVKENSSDLIAQDIIKFFKLK